MINGLMSVCVVFLLLAVGFYFTKREKWPGNTNKVLSTVVVQIAAPALAITSIENRFNPQLLMAFGKNLVMITICIFILHFIGILLAKIMKLSKKKKAVFVTTFTFNNAMFIGLPINQIVFGHDGLPYLFTYYLVIIVLFWSLGAYTLSKASDEGGKSFSVKKIFSPGLIGVMIGCLLAAFGWTLPDILEKSLEYLGDMTVPMSLLVIGSNLSTSLKNGPVKIDVSTVVIMVGKFLISPALMYAVCLIFHVTGLPMSVFILSASLPCHAQTAIMAEYYDLESEYASNLVSISTLICLVTIPVYAALLT